MTETRCLRCGRVLRVSVGYGPRCAARIRKAAIEAAFAGFTPEQQAKAAELIRDGGLVPTSRPGVYRTVSSRGDVTYLTHSAACNCPGGLHGRLCYHVAAARVLSATTRKAA